MIKQFSALIKQFKLILHILRVGFKKVFAFVLIVGDSLRFLGKYSEAINCLD